MDKINQHMRFVLECEMNVQLNKLNEASEEISLLNHWSLHFDKMDEIIQKEVIDKVNERIKNKAFYKDFSLENGFAYE